MDALIESAAAEIAARAPRELDALVAISSPSGDVGGAEEAIAVCTALLPAEADAQRIPCSTSGSAHDLVGTIAGTGSRRALLLGHVDTVIAHESHASLRPEGDRLYGPGAADMKGGVVLALGVARALAAHSETFAELAVLIVTDEEWRTQEFAHAQRFAGYDACLCFEAGQLTGDGDEAVIVRRKAAGTLRVVAAGRASHSGSAPDQGRNALLGLANAAMSLSRHHDPSGPQHLSVVPTVMRAGEAFNVVPAAGELLFDMRADGVEAFDEVLATVPPDLDGVGLTATLERRWPGMNCTETTRGLLEAAGERIGRPIIGAARGGASDASHFAATVPITVDGLGPRGGGAHTPHEFVLVPALRQRAEVALAVAAEVLDMNR